MPSPDRSFTAEFGHHDRDTWAALTAGFCDANLYQTWAYDTVRYGPRRVLHVIVRRDGTVVAAAQARVVRLPATQAGIAYVRWGPLWRRAGTPDDVDVFRRAVRALRDELSRRRGLVVRVYPLAFRGHDEAAARVLEEEGFRPSHRVQRDRTLVIDLAPSFTELRASLDQKWRNCLNRAERSALHMTCGHDDALFDAVETMHAQMTARKGLPRQTEIGHLRKVQRELPAGQKLWIVVCRRGGALCAGGVVGAIGDTGIYLTGATSDAGLTTNASYMVQWTFVKWLKERGVSRYDLNGINPEANPGTYHFKRGLAGRRGCEQQFLGTFQASDGRLSEWVVNGGERLVAGYRRLVGTAVATGRAR